MSVEIKHIITNEAQNEIAATIFKNRFFALKFFSLLGNSEALKAFKISIFKDSRLNALMKIFYKVYLDNDSIIPTVGIMSTYIANSQTLKSAEKDALNEKMDEIYGLKVGDVKLYEKQLIILLRKALTAYSGQNQYKMITEGLEGEKLNEYLESCQDFIRQYNSISFNEIDTIYPTNILELVEMGNVETSSNVPTGFREIDDKLNGGGEHGGAARGELCIILAPLNDGKSTIMTNISTNNALYYDNKGIHISYEGKKFQPIYRSIAKATKIPYKKLVTYLSWKKQGNVGGVRKYFTPDEIERIEEAEKKLGKNLRFCHELENNDITQVLSFLREKYLEDPYDYAVLDYLQKITSSKPFARHDLMYEYICLELEKLAVELNIAIFSAQQVKTEGIKRVHEEANSGIEYPIYRKEEGADSKKPMDIAATGLAWCRTDSERKEAKGRLAIIKQREGVVNYQVGYSAKWDIMDLSHVDTYYEGIYGGQEEGSNNGSLSILQSELDRLSISDIIKEENENFVQERIESSKVLTLLNNIDTQSSDFVALQDILQRRVEFFSNISESDDEDFINETKSQIDALEQGETLSDLVETLYGKKKIELLIVKRNVIDKIVEDIATSEYLEKYSDFLESCEAILSLSEFYRIKRNKDDKEESKE